MLRHILKYLVIIVIIQALIFVMISVFVTNNNIFSVYIPVMSSTSKYAKKIYGSVCRTIIRTNRHGLSGLCRAEPEAGHEQGRSAWVDENTLYRFADVPVSVKVVNIKTENRGWATIEIKHADGRVEMFGGVKKGESKLLNGEKYYIKLLDLRDKKSTTGRGCKE